MMDDQELRYRALVLANRSDATQKQILDTAKAFYEWMIAKEEIEKK